MPDGREQLLTGHEGAMAWADIQAAKKVRPEVIARLAVSLAGDDTRLPYLQERLPVYQLQDMPDLREVLSPLEMRMIEQAEFLVQTIEKGSRR